MENRTVVTRGKVGRGNWEMKIKGYKVSSTDKSRDLMFNMRTVR